jgi:MFS family permease
MAVCQGSVLLALPLFALDLGAGIGVTALVFSLRGLGNMAIDLPAGWAVARFGDKAVMLTAVGLMLTTALLASQSTSPMQLGFAAFAFGASVAAWLLARLTHISDKVPASHRGKAISTMAGIQRIGSLVGPVITGFIVHQYSFEHAFYAIAVFAFLTLMIIIFNVHKKTALDKQQHHSILKIVPHILKDHSRVFATAGIAILCLTMIRAARQLLVPLWGEHIGLTANEIGLVVGAAAAVDMLLFPIAGYVMDNFGRRYTSVACLGGIAIGLFVMPFTEHFYSFMFAVMIAGAGNGLGSGINMTLGADYAPEAIRGQFLGVWRLVSDTGSLAGPVVIGYVASLLGLFSAFPFIAGIGLLGSAIVIFTVKETLPESSNKAS